MPHRRSVLVRVSTVVAAAAVVVAAALALGGRSGPGVSLDAARFVPFAVDAGVQSMEMLQGARPQALRIAGFLGEPLDLEKMAQVVDVQLYRNRSGPTLLHVAQAA